MTEADLPVVTRLERASFSDPWPASGFLELLHAPHSLLTVAEERGTVVGYSVLVVVADEAELANLAVDPAWHRRGIAQHLVRGVMQEAGQRGARTLYLEVREGNLAARALYAGLGFSAIGRRPGYYRHPDEDALVLQRALDVA
jgi:ribosomal-protein-alanine N-acetyltransferase